MVNTDNTQPQITDNTADDEDELANELELEKITATAGALSTAVDLPELMEQYYNRPDQDQTFLEWLSDYAREALRLGQTGPSIGIIAFKHYAGLRWAFHLREKELAWVRKES
jgi:hypothetical protein